MATFKFELVSPERLLLATDAVQVDLPGSEGELGVLAGHAPLITRLGTGVVTVKSGSGSARYYLRGGYADVTADKVTVLADKALPIAELTADVVAGETALLEGIAAGASTDVQREAAKVGLLRLRTLAA